MRKIYWFLWICCMAAMVSACSNDDDEPGMEKPGDNGGSMTGGDEIWEEGVRRVKSIREIDPLGLQADLIRFDYNGKVVRGFGVVTKMWEEKPRFNLTVGTSFVEVSTESHPYVCSLPLEEGKIVRGKCEPWREDDYSSFDFDSCYCTYENGYLQQMQNKEFDYDNYSYEFIKERVINQYFTFASGNLAERKYLNDRDETKWVYSYSKEVRNDANIDLFVLLDKYLEERGSLEYEDDIDDYFCLGMFGFFGERNKSLPTRVIRQSTDTWKNSEWDISYEVDEEGYPVRIKMQEKDSDEVKVLGIYY